MFHGGTTMPDPKALGQTRRQFPRIAAIIELSPSGRAACAAVANERALRGTLGHVRFWPETGRSSIEKAAIHPRRCTVACGFWKHAAVLGAQVFEKRARAQGSYPRSRRSGL